MTTLIGRAYAVGIPADYVGLPAWATTDRYDVIATSSLTNPAQEQRAAMTQAMLADRFKLLAHVENREQQVYNLVLARSDGRLGAQRGLHGSAVIFRRLDAGTAVTIVDEGEQGWLAS